MTLDRRTFVKGALGASGAYSSGPPGPPGTPGPREPPGRRTSPIRRGRAPPTGEVRDRARHRRDDGEPELRPLPRLVAPRRRQAGRPLVRRSSGHAPRHVPSDPVQRLRLHRPRPLLRRRRLQYNGGKMDGFLSDPANDTFAIGYYTAADRPFMSRLARAYTTCDRYFCSILAPTYPNRFFQHAGRPTASTIRSPSPHCPPFGTSSITREARPVATTTATCRSSHCGEARTRRFRPRSPRS